MYCGRCGAELPEGSQFCTTCGQSVSGSGMAEQNMINQTPVNNQYQNSQYGNYQGVNIQNSSSGYVELPMNWHKFLAYFALWLGAVVNLGSAIQAFTGSQYKGEADRVYSLIPGLKSVDMIYAVMVFILVALQVLAAVSLIKMKKNGPLFLYLVYGMSLLSTFVYMIMINSVLSESVKDAISDLYSGMGRSIATSIIMLIVNYVYYNKRKHMFVN